MSEEIKTIIKGRGATENTPNRFEKLSLDPDIITNSIKTEVFLDHSKTILATNDSPDVPFDFSINPYRGCEHGCIYCYARPTHEYLGFSAGLDFETKIMVKLNAAELLREKLMSLQWVPACISLSGVTDCYQPIERQFKLTRQCLEILAEFRNPFTVITKNHLVTRDLDIFKQMAEITATAVFITITTLDHDLCARLEPRTSRPSLRLQAIETIAKAGIPVGVMVSPVIPALTDHEIPNILAEARKAGATYSGIVTLRLPFAVAPLFERWLEAHYPNRKNKVLNRIRDLRGGKLNDANFNSRMHGEGEFATQIRSLFQLYSRKLGFNQRPLNLATHHFRRPGDQLSLFHPTDT